MPMWSRSALSPPPILTPPLKILKTSTPNGGRPLFISIIIRARSIFDFRHAVHSLPSVDTVPRTVPTVPGRFRKTQIEIFLVFFNKRTTVP